MKKELLRGGILFCLLLSVLGVKAEDGSRLWLRYDSLNNAKVTGPACKASEVLRTFYGGRQVMLTLQPTRIAFRLPERIDSQVILDCDGAEELLGNGDMLFIAGKSIDCIRLQCAFVDTTEVNRICQFVSQQQGYISPFELPDPYFDENEYGEANDVAMTHLDPLFEEAAYIIVQSQVGSQSLIQRRFTIGYDRAGRLMDQLEKAGIVGAAHGLNPREVLITDETSLENLFNALRW